ncbi:MAG TPA: tripartite tricarboxylate transporter permease [Rhizobium sp.]
MNGVHDLFLNLGIGFQTALSWHNLAICFAGVFVGMVIGVLPGIGSLSAISMLFPILLHMDPTSALIMLAGIYYGTAYGGSTTAILLNIPGSTSSTVSCLDGYPMARQGRAGVALFLTTAASFVAGSIGILLMMLFSPMIVEIAFAFGSTEYFAIMVLGLVMTAGVSEGSAIKAIAMVLFGIMLGLVGIDPDSGASRFTFGYTSLFDGVSLTALAMGIFGIAEVVSSLHDPETPKPERVRLRDMIPTSDDRRRFWGPTLRGTAIGSFFGALPGTGATVASFISYAFEKRIARDPSRFGKGAVEGICAPEAANNAADQTAFIPTMTLGIPGSPTMALILSILIIQNITPGPRLMVDHPEMFWGLVASFWLGNLMLVILNIPMIGLWVRVLQIPYPVLYPAILLFVCFGVYGINNSADDLIQTLIFGLFGYAMRQFGFPAPPLLLGFVLGPLMEEHFRRALTLSHGDPTIFFHSPISASILVLSAVVLLMAVALTVRRQKKGRTSASSASPEETPPLSSNPGESRHD